MIYLLVTPQTCQETRFYQQIRPPQIEIRPSRVFLFADTPSEFFFCNLINQRILTSWSVYYNFFLEYLGWILQDWPTWYASEGNNRLLLLFFISIFVFIRHEQGDNINNLLSLRIKLNLVFVFLVQTPGINWAFVKLFRLLLLCYNLIVSWIYFFVIFLLDCQFSCLLLVYLELVLIHGAPINHRDVNLTHILVSLLRRWLASLRLISR